MKFLLTVFFLLSTFNLFADEIPDAPLGMCDNNSCTKKMESIYKNFLKSSNAPFIVPGMYSGECYHQSDMLDPNTTHYLGVMFDYNTLNNNQLYMAPVFQYFGDGNDMKEWSLETARKEMSESWKTSGVISVHPTSFTAMVADDGGSPVYIYWAKQNKQTKKLYFLSYMRGFSFAFCEARLN